VENLRSKYLYKIELYLVKVIPILSSGLCLLNTILSYFGIEAPFLSYVGGNSLFTIIFLYLSSIVFRFCFYHRIFIHYITLNWALNIYDYYIGISPTNRGLFLIMCVTGILLFILLYLHLRKLKHV
jgi:hypothetical protein